MVLANGLFSRAELITGCDIFFSSSLQEELDKEFDVKVLGLLSSTSFKSIFIRFVALNFKYKTIVL